MPKIKYINKRFGVSSSLMIVRANDIISEYQAEGYVLTLRQLYYQFVSRNFIRNTQAEYRRLTNIMSSARLAGLVDWDAIVDLTRNLKSLSHWNNPHEIVYSAAKQYRIDKWKSQPNRIEVWIEKDALLGIIEKICNELDVPYISCRGYISQSAMWRAAQRFRKYHIEEEQEPMVIHLADHDPSGLDMTEDIRKRFKILAPDCSVMVDRIALTIEQVNEYGLPPNPAKVTDSRAESYIREFGESSWELDALHPRNIRTLIEKEIKAFRVKSKWEESVEREKEDRAKLRQIAKEMDDE